MAIIFDGKAFARQKEKKLKASGKHPKLVSIIVGSDPASVMYVGMKKKAAERVGASVEVVGLAETSDAYEVINKIHEFNSNKEVSGIMVQLPLPNGLKSETAKILGSIDPKKDVDGLRKDSMFSHPTAMAVMQIIREAEVALSKKLKTIYVLGKEGMVGRAVAREVGKTDIKLIDESTSADIVVSATGTQGILKEEMIKDGAVIIDVGSPKGDVDFETVSKKADFITPVPGGVGPVTISCLLENLMSF